MCVFNFQVIVIGLSCHVMKYVNLLECYNKIIIEITDIGSTAQLLGYEIRYKNICFKLQKFI